MFYNWNMPKLRSLHLLTAWLAVTIILALLGPTHGQSEAGAVYISEVRGVISPPVAIYLRRVLDEAAAANASALIIQIDTPGGLDTSMREIIQATLDSPVPVVTYVSPAGARAASAGLFLLMTSHIAAMAPSTNTGSAHPVGMGGEEIDEVMSAKVVNDAAALIRSLAVRYGRNADWAEQAVRESVSVTDQEALSLNIIDVVATDVDDLLRQIDGRNVTVSTGEVTLRVAGVPAHHVPMTFPEAFLHVILSPDLAFILLTVGSIGIIAELYNPGMLVPGITGVMSLILAFFALGTLPTNWAGVALIVMAIILFIAELNTETTGVLAVGGLVAFVLGAFILFRPFQPLSPVQPQLEVNPWLIGVMTAGLAGFTLLVIGRVMTTRKSPVLTGYEQFFGQTAQVHRDLSPVGRVWFQGQAWFARTLSGEEVKAGRAVRIIGLDDLTLIVEPFETDTMPGDVL